MLETSILLSAYILDIVIGDPKWLPHPVKVIGWATIKLESFLRGFEMVQNGSVWFKNTSSLKFAGVILVCTIVGATYAIFYIIDSILYLTPHFSFFIFIIFVYLTSTTIATHELVKSASSVIKSVKVGDIECARRNLSQIVGRDTQSLNKKDILRATIETLAENASDGIIAPLLYFLIGGLPLAMTYKAINTLDSMIGYKNERYKDFGWAAARLDDIVNYIPARITGILIVIATSILNISSSIFHFPSSIFHELNVSGINAFRIMLTDGRKHPSPNSGIPEAAMAGALGIRLGGPSFYGGILVKKPYIGLETQDRECKTQNIDKKYLEAAVSTVTITKITSFLGLLSSLVILYLRNTL